ncbi:MAG: aldehyde dehydrogenase family protein [Armatimonadota bacterium]
MIDTHSTIAGEPVATDRKLAVHYPYTGELVGEVSMLGPEHVERLLAAHAKPFEPLTRYRRYEILNRAREIVAAQADALAHLIRSETGLAMKETRYEVGRAQDVLQFAAMEALRDDGEVFSCDVSPQGKPRKIFTLREPHRLALGITPFNHPLNQVAHKVAPAIAAGCPMLLKPSERTPLTALRFAEILHEAGLPGWMLSVFVAPIDAVVEPLIRDERIEIVTFTGGSAVGKGIARIAGYKKLCLELGGCSPLIVMRDADLDLAASLAAEGCYRNSGQRCTSVRRILVDRPVLEAFTERFLGAASAFVAGDPADETTTVGTVITEASAIELETRVHRAVADGATLLRGGGRRGAQLEPTVLANVPRTTTLVAQESFGPIAPIVPVDGIDDAIGYANDTPYGLSSGIVTNDMNGVLKTVKGLRVGTVNVNQVPGYRIECSPFGGVKDSGLGIKEGVIEAMKFLSTVKTFSLPW